ncbi:Endoplasmic reticulum metallopeptidase 1 [Nymphon striatum]|nr:Endoplasmic reticulum metallopeptidase 1 [Nymphon striatum]
MLSYAQYHSIPIPANGPDHAWEVTAYSTAAHYPFGSIIAQEIFYSGLVPTETDYRVLRDFGHIPGIGLIYIKNGYVHDTVYDTVDLLSDDDLKYSAETLLNIVSYILRSPYLMHPLDLRNGKIVYFDMFGLFIVAYSQDRAFVINESIAILILLELLFKIKRSGRLDSTKSKELTKRLVTASGSLIFCWAVTIGLNAALGAIMGASGYGLTWKESAEELENLQPIVHSNSVRINAPIPQIEAKPSRLICKAKIMVVFSVKMLCIYIISLIIPMSMTVYMAHLIFVIIIPVLGRAGSSINSDLILAVICAIMVILCLAYLTTLIHLSVQHFWKAIPVLIFFFFITVIIMISSNLGFPYTVDQNYPVPQKYIIQHIHRNDSRVINSGYWIIPLDFNGPRNLFNDVPKLKEAKSISADCDNKLFCDVPIYTYFLNTTSEDDPNSDIIDVNKAVTRCNKDAIAPYITRYTFHIEGPDHMSAQLLFKPDVMLMRWSIDALIPDPPQVIDASTAFFVFFSRGGTVSDSEPGSRPYSSWSFWIEVSGLEDNMTDMVDIAISRHFLHGRYSHTLKFSKFLATFPNWTHITSWTSTYEKYSTQDLCE